VSFGRYDVPPLSFAVLDVYYRTSWVAERMVDIIPKSMCSKWRRFVHADPEVVKKTRSG